MIAYVPARGGSKRIPRKNIRPLAGKPVIRHVIDTLRQLDFIDTVCVSTDDSEIQTIAETAGAVTLGPRPPELADDRADFGDLVRHDIGRYCSALGGDRQVLFVLATAALVPARIYRDAHAVYLRERPELLMSCMEYPVSPCWAMEPRGDGYWKMRYPDKVFCNSQDLPPALVDAGLFYFFELETVQQYQDLKLVDRLLPCVVDARYAVDVDTPGEWAMLEMKYEFLQDRTTEAD